MQIQDEVYVSRPLNGVKSSDSKLFKILSEEMKKDASRATRIQIVSGYFSSDYVLDLLCNVSSKKRKNCNVTLIFGYETIVDLIYAQKCISGLNNELIEKGYKKENVEIKLFKNGVPLHTKLYGFLIKTHPVWYVGSANFSKALAGARDELMVRITGKSHSLETYIKTLLATDSCEEFIDDHEFYEMTRFFSAGAILFRPSRQRRFTYEGFDIKPEERRILSAQLGKVSSVPHSDPSAEGFGFDLLSALGMSDEKNLERNVVKIRPYCVETDYGYWVPGAYIYKIESKIKNGMIEEEKKFISIRDMLNSIDDKKLVSEFQNYIDASRIFFGQIGVNPKEKKDVIRAFKSFINVRRAWLQDSGWISRNSRRLFLTKMPDIWGDASAAEIFITSFCENISSVLNSPDRKPHIYSEISKSLILSETPTVDEIKYKLKSVNISFLK